MSHPDKRYFFLILPISLILAAQSCAFIPAPDPATVTVTASATAIDSATLTVTKTQALVTIAPLNPTDSQPADESSSNTSGELSIGYPFSPSFVDYFNTVNLPTDYVAVGLPGLESISTLTVGQKVLMFGSVSRLKEYPEEVFSQVDTIGFDLERGAVPEEEQEDLVRTVQEAAEFARMKNMKFMLAPVARWTEQLGVLLVLYADVIVMQMMRYQSDPVLCPEKISEFSRKLRAANPGLEIYVQFSTQRDETPAQLFACIDAVRDDIDGVWIQWHYRDEGGPKEGPPNFEELQELIGLIRPQP